MRYRTVAIFLILLNILIFSGASEGDYDSNYQYCLRTCNQRCSLEEKLNEEIYNRRVGLPSTLPVHLIQQYKNQERLEAEAAKLGEWRGPFLTLFMWSCPENCQYTCMQENEARRAARGLSPVKYYGKWPFTRYFGTQELLSTVFSLANMVPFVQYWSRWPCLSPKSYFMRRAWQGYALAGANTWFWSTAFHARDNLLTERLDYFCATFSIMYLLWMTVLRLGRLQTTRSWVFAAIPFIGYYIWHCWTLHMVHFDYGWNMTVMLVFGFTYVITWFVWGFSNWKTHKYAWKIVYANAIILFFALFEVFDFPPVFGLLDAHATWHAATPLASYLTWSFAVDDAVHVANVEAHKWV